MYKIMHRKLMAILICGLLVLFSGQALACTLWSAAGDAAGGGTIIVKNRDWEPDHVQKLRLVTPDTGYRYYGLFVVNGNHKGLKAGINEQGLVIVSASAGSIPSLERKKMQYTPALSAKLLRECASVAEAVSKTELFIGPQILMLADKTQTAVIEIGPDGKYSITQQQNGILAHTNHYIDESMLIHNKKISKSSEVRYQRINELLTNAARPYNLESFINMTRDQNAGPDNSIFRTGSTPKKARTMAVFAAVLSPEEAPQIYVRLHNPDDEERSFRINSAEVFK